jgi:hypothetical protein
MRNSNASVQTALMPTAEQRSSVPASRISPQAQALLDLYPLRTSPATRATTTSFRIVSGHLEDDLQARVNKQKGSNFFSGNLAWQSIRTDSPDVFGFLSTGGTSESTLASDIGVRSVPEAL